MSPDDLTQVSRPGVRGHACVVIAAADGDERLRACEESVREHTAANTPIVTVSASTAAVNRALEQVAPADAVLLSEPCLVSAGWLERLRNAARADTNTATASALADAGTPLALADVDRPVDDLAALEHGVAEHTLALRPRLSRAVGPCVYLRRDALELVGPLDERLDLDRAVEADFARRCLLAGLAHVAADDVVVGHVGEPPANPAPGAQPEIAASSVLPLALEAARGPRTRIWVTIDARALDGAVTGTQLHILELARALARTGALRLRLLVWAERIDSATLELLRSLPETEVLAAEDVDDTTPRSAVFHRPQQTFSPGDVALASRLGERIVLSQLDLIAYRNPGYFADAGAWEDYRRASRHGMSAAERVVVFSEHTRRELLSDALVDAQRIRVVPPGLDHRRAAAPLRPSTLDLSEEAELLLCLGTDFHHKNRMFALRLLAALRERHAWQGNLVLAGTHIPHGSSRELERALLDERPELRASVIELGPVTEAEKAWLLERADAVVYPSVYEGFGLVPFESALHGVPCLFAPQSSLAEGAAARAATIVPWDPVASADGARALLTDPAVRARHVRVLADAARGLTWERTAAAMVDVYREAAVAPVRDAATLSHDAVDRECELTAAHAAVAQKLIDERELVLHDYDTLLAEVGPGRSLVGPHGSLPDDVQRGLLALSAHPALSRPLYGVAALTLRLARAVARVVRRLWPV